MNRPDRERLLWELSSAIEEREDGVPADRVLAAYREGGLSKDERERVETVLAGNREARRRLAQLAGVALPNPPARVRDRVLFALPRRSARPTQLRRRVAVAAAAVLAMATGYWLLATRGVSQFPGGLPAGLEYDVEVRAIADLRSEAAGTGDWAYPQTPLSIVVEPRADGVAGVAFGLYVERRGRLERLWPRPWPWSRGRRISFTRHRGAATFEGLAADILGPEPGTYGLFVVVAEASNLRRGRRLAAGENAEAALGAGPHRLVYERRIAVRGAPPGDGGLTGPEHRPSRSGEVDNQGVDR